MVERWSTGLRERISAHPSESRVVGWGRSVIALAQASILVFTPTSYLFVPVGPTAARPTCDGVEAVSAFCVNGGDHRQATAWVLVGLLLVIASGLLPRYLSVVHFWIALSLNQSLSLPDGGEAAAQTVTLFLVLASVNDRRLFHWQRGRPRSDSVLQGVAWAGSWGVRLQVAYIYLNSSLAKLAVEPWQDGTATYYVSRMESFGAAGVGADVIRAATGQPVLALATTWGSIAVEFMIAWFVLSGGRRHAVALAASTALHISIMVQLGIVSFALIMIGCVTCAAASGLEGLRRARPPRPAQAGVEEDQPPVSAGTPAAPVGTAPATHGGGAGAAPPARAEEVREDPAAVP